MPPVLRPMLSWNKTTRARALNNYQDHYSDDMIYLGNVVCMLWDIEAWDNVEFECARGDYIQVVRLYNNHWATSLSLGGISECNENT